MRFTVVSYWVSTLDNVPSEMCTQLRFKSAWAFAEYSLPAWRKFVSWLVKIQIWLHKSAGWSESLLGAHIRRYVFCRCGSTNEVDITKTYLYNFDPLKPHFYIVKLGFAGVYIIFLISTQNIDCGYSLELSHRGGSNEYNLCFEQKYEKYLNFFIRNFSFFVGKIFQYIWIGMFS